MTSAEDAKRRLRAEAKARRHETHRQWKDRAGAAVRDRFVAAFDVPAGDAVGSYWPMADELDSAPLLHRLHEQGHVCALPAVTGPGQPLVFGRWQPGATLRRGRLGEPMPAEDAPVVTPRWLLVPLLAYDRAGYRLGYGGGFYDRTIGRLRRDGTLAAAVGLAYSAQEVHAVPHEAGDERLDWVVTEAEVINIEPEAG